MQGKRSRTPTRTHTREDGAREQGHSARGVKGEPPARANNSQEQSDSTGEEGKIRTGKRPAARKPAVSRSSMAVEAASSLTAWAAPPNELCCAPFSLRPTFSLTGLAQTLWRCRSWACSTHGSVPRQYGPSTRGGASVREVLRPRRPRVRLLSLLAPLATMADACSPTTLLASVSCVH